MPPGPEPYPVRLTVDQPGELDRVTTFARLIWAIPIVIVLSLITATGNETVVRETGDQVTRSGGGIGGGLFAATALMLVFRQRYPRWWFDFALELARFSARVSAYLTLLTDRYPSTVEEQSVHLEIDYPDAEADLNRWLPLVKWLLAIPHYIVLILLARRGDRRGRHRVVRHPVHRSLPTGAVRLRRRRRQVGPTGAGLRVPARHRSVPAVQPRVTGPPDAPRRRRVRRHRPSRS